MAAIHNISDKTPLDFLTQLETWNYQYSEPTDQFFKYVGMGMMVLYSDWKLTFIIKCNNGRLLPHASKQITESIENLPWAEAEVFSDYLQLNEPLMLAITPKTLV